MIYIVRNEVDPHYIDEYLDWQETEHIPWIINTPGYKTVERFRGITNNSFFMNIWNLEDISCYDSDYKQSLSHSPWSMRLRQHRQFDTEFYDSVFDVNSGDKYVGMVNFFISDKEADSIKFFLSSNGNDLLNKDVTRLSFFKSLRGKRGGFMLSCFISNSLTASMKSIVDLYSGLVKAGYTGGLGNIEAVYCISDPLGQDAYQNVVIPGGKK